MEKQELDEKIAETSKTILSYCMARTSNQYDAEDLAQEILLEIYKSSANIRDDRAFYGFLWSVAGNVYRQWCRKKQRDSHSELSEEIPAKEGDPLNLLAEDSDIRLLRRELTLLADKYRRAMLLYYLDNHSCAQIARKLSVSESMVKYLLFKSRQIVKEGMNMERKLGEQSYNPKRLQIGFWGGHNYYSRICDSSISQNILFACYNDKLTAEQISLAIGVALPYMEDKLKELCEYELLKADGKRYYTNLVIFTKEFDIEANAKTMASTKRIAEIVRRTLEEKENEVREIGFYGADMDKNTFAWQMTCILLRHAAIDRLEEHAGLQYPVDKFGEECFVWGVEKYDSEIPKTFHFANCTVQNKKEEQILFMDFAINGEKIHPLFFSRQDYTNVLLDLAGGMAEAFGENDKTVLADMVRRGIARNENGKIYPNMPVLTAVQQEILHEILEKASGEIEAEAQGLTADVADVLRSHVPAHLKKSARELAFIKIRDNCISGPVEILCRDKYLLPAGSGSMLPTTYAVINPSAE